jgi:hypothetical protein
MRDIFMRSAILAVLTSLLASAELTGASQPPPETAKRITITSPDEGSTYPTAPVRLEATLSRGARASDFRAFLNQHDVTSSFAAAGNCNPGHCELAATVVPQDGLQRGSNTLRIEVREPNGSLTRVTRSFSVSGPTADAGPDLRTRIAQPVWLDGERSPSGLPLTYHWELIEKPERSTATITDPFSATASLTPDVSGRYVAQLIVNDGFFDSNPDTLILIATTGSLLVPVKTGHCAGRTMGIS